MIEQVTDAWYHLSLANKINQFSTLEINHHLTGVASYNYPKLWHVNLAVLQQLSDLPLPVLWNSFTAWGGVLKASAFFLFALRLSRCSRIAGVSVLLFVLLPGFGPSYLRVSAWPAHVSYTAWFFLFSIVFVYLDSFNDNREKIFHKRKVTSVLKNLAVDEKRIGLLTMAIILLYVIYFSHRVELVWLAFGVFFYSLSLLISNLLRENKDKENLIASWLLNIYLRCSLVAIALFTMIHYGNLILHNMVDITQLFICGGVVTLCLIFLFVDYLLRTVTTKDYKGYLIFALIVASVLLFITVDYRHLYSLFFPAAGYPRPPVNELPHILESWAGGRLQLPSWHMQLRGGLLYSGALGIGLSVLILLFERNRLTLFLAANCIFPFCFLISPYLYTWLSDLLQYHSSWRISLLIFSPIVLAYCMVSLSEKFTGRVK